jgi:imidazole glycerol-phosphate synthase subunit HisF
MLRTRFIPCLLLKDSALVKTVKFKNPQYVGDPINAVRIFNEKEVDELVLLDISASGEKRGPSFKLLSEIASECFMPLSYGGGIRTIEEIRQLLSIGIEKVIINTYACENPDFVREAAEKFGSQSLIISIDVKRTFFGKYEVMSLGARRKTGLDPLIFAQRMEELGAGELLINSVDRDGTWQGYDLELIRTITDSVSIPTIACGGASGLEDLSEAVLKGGASAVAAGSMVVFQGKDLGVLINFPTTEEIKAYLP